MTALLLCLLALVAYAVLLGIYRLYLSPLSHFPGPKLAALTGWYEVWYDVVIGGQFTFQIEKWHQKYGTFLSLDSQNHAPLKHLANLLAGPIIRIRPDEVHISDPDFYNELYTTTAAFQKPDDWRYRFGYGTALFDTVDHDHHNRRKAPLAAFFSRSKILEFSGVIQAETDKLVHRIKEEFKGQVVCVNEAFDALTMDIISFYSFGLSYHSIDYPNLEAPFNAVTEDVARMVHIAGHFPWILTILKALPQSLVASMSPPMKKIFKFQEVCIKPPPTTVQVAHVHGLGNCRTNSQDPQWPKQP
jgi:hypothetical protein